MLFSSLPSLESGSEIVQSLIPHYERRVLFGLPYAVGTERWLPARHVAAQPQSSARAMYEVLTMHSSLEGCFLMEEQENELLEVGE